MRKLITISLIFVLLVLGACRTQGPEATGTQMATAESAAETGAQSTVEPADDSEAELTAEAVDIEAEAGMLDLGALTAHPWQWVFFTNPVEQFDVDTPARYLLTFNEDGTVTIVADCNNAAGSYAADESSLTIDLGPATLAACPADSRGEQFVTLLGGAALYFFEDGNLFIDLMADGGTMAFAPADAEAIADDGERAMAGAAFPPAEIANDEGGPEIVTGEFDYTSYIVPNYLNQSVVGLIDASYLINGNFSEFVPPENQVLGTVTSPVSPSPITYQVLLPITPPGASIDVDNDGDQEDSLQAFAAAIAPNYYGDITLDPMEQDWFHSYLTDPQTGVVREGSFLLYAPDDAQGFPATAGDDSVYFTADDPIVGLPAGYTVATLDRDGVVTFDRSREGTINFLESAETASPDFSNQGILESYNSLIDLLKVRYSYTDLRDLDWEAIREAYLPQVEEADEAEDLSAYYSALREMAQSIQDAHVQVSGTGYTTAYFKAAGEQVGVRLGAQLVELDDGRFTITWVDPEGPTAEAGWEFGTEIISVDGEPTEEYVAARPVFSSLGTPETVRLARLNNALAYPMGTTTTTVEYRQPGESEVRSATLTPVEDVANAPLLTGEELARPEIDFRELEGGEGYIRWSAFSNLAYKVAVFERALETFQAAPGIVLDLRGNGGGNVGLYFTLASYFFTADDPAPVGWLDWYAYDDAVGDLVKEFRVDHTLSAPRPEIAYNGPVVVLVDENSASAGEYFPQYLQAMGRALIIGEHSTEGAGGPIERAYLPGGISFQFTKGRTYFADTDELNLEAKGVNLDVEVPITEENERAKLEGVDVVLEAGLEALAEEGARLAGERLLDTSWQMIQEVGLEGNVLTEIEDPTAYTLTFDEAGGVAIQADCNVANGEYTIGGGGTITITVGPTTLAACQEGSSSEAFLAALAEVDTVQVDGESLGLSGTLESSQPVFMLFQPASTETEE